MSELYLVRNSYKCRHSSRYTMRMKCGVGKCGRCNIGSHFICLDGPVFTRAEIAAMGAA